MPLLRPLHHVGLSRDWSIGMTKPALLLTGASGIFGAALTNTFADKYRFICLPSNKLRCAQNNNIQPFNADTRWVYCNFSKPETIEDVIRGVLVFEPIILRLVNAAAETRVRTH
jgi:hypothetical protein